MSLTAPNIPLSQSAENTLLLSAHAALKNMREGRGADGFDDLAQAINWSMCLAEVGYGFDELPSIREAQDALMRSVARFSEKGRHGIDGPGLRALAGGLAVLEAQVEAAPVSHLLQALLEVRRRLDAEIVLRNKGKSV
jgi:hypothetical protein